MFRIVTQKNDTRKDTSFFLSCPDSLKISHTTSNKLFISFLIIFIHFPPNLLVSTPALFVFVVFFIVALYINNSTLKKKSIYNE